MSVGVVSKHLIELIAEQVEDHAIVIWYDPERAYDSAFRALEPRTKSCANVRGPS